MRKEIVFDLILKKFEGNKSFSWDQVHEKEFYESIHSDYYVVENHLNFLIGENLIKEMGVPVYLSLSRKGWFVMTNNKQEGFVAKRKKEKDERNLKWGLAIISVATFIFVTLRFYSDFGSPHKLDSTPNKDSSIQLLPHK